MDQWITFAQERWVIIVAAIVALFVVLKVVKTVMKWVIVIIIAALVVAYGAKYVSDLKEIGSKVVEFSKDEAVKALIGGAGEATYEANGDGTFTIKTKLVELNGSIGSDTLTITFYGKNFDVSMDDKLKNTIEQIKERSS